MKTKMKMRKNVYLYIFWGFLNSIWPIDAIDGQLSLTWPRSARACYLTNLVHGLAVSYMVNTLLIGLEPSWHFNYDL